MTPYGLAATAMVLAAALAGVPAAAQAPAAPQEKPVKEQLVFSS